MKKRHRKAHLYIWLLLLPILCFVLFTANKARAEIGPTIEPISTAINGVKLQ